MNHHLGLQQRANMIAGPHAAIIDDDVARPHLASQRLQLLTQARQHGRAIFMQGVRI